MSIDQMNPQPSNVPSDNPPPLVPRSPAGGIAAGSVAGVIVAALGWSYQELITLEKVVQEAETRIEYIAEERGKRLDEMDEDVDNIRERLAVIEKELLEIESYKP